MIRFQPKFLHKKQCTTARLLLCLRKPPVAVKVIAEPGQTVKDGVPVTEVAALDKELTVTITV